MIDVKAFRIKFEMLGTNSLNNETLFTEFYDVIERYPESVLIFVEVENLVKAYPALFEFADRLV